MGKLTFACLLLLACVLAEISCLPLIPHYAGCNHLYYPGQKCLHGSYYNYQYCGCHKPVVSHIKVDAGKGCCISRADPSNDRAYLLLDNGIPTRMWCAPGTVYSAGVCGCTHPPKAPEPEAPKPVAKVEEPPTCLSSADASDSAAFIVIVHGVDTQMFCASGTAYSQGDCGCTLHAAPVVVPEVAPDAAVPEAAPEAAAPEAAAPEVAAPEAAPEAVPSAVPEAAAPEAVPEVAAAEASAEASAVAVGDAVAEASAEASAGDGAAEASAVASAEASAEAVAEATAEAVAEVAAPEAAPSSVPEAAPEVVPEVAPSAAAPEAAVVEVAVVEAAPEPAAVEPTVPVAPKEEVDPELAAAVAATGPMCHNLADPSDHRAYFVVEHGEKKKMMCAPGSLYSPVTCACGVNLLTAVGHHIHAAHPVYHYPHNCVGYPGYYHGLPAHAGHINCL